MQLGVRRDTLDGQRDLRVKRGLNRSSWNGGDPNLRANLEEQLGGEGERFRPDEPGEKAKKKVGWGGEGENKEDKLSKDSYKKTKEPL